MFPFSASSDLAIDLRPPPLSLLEVVSSSDDRAATITDAADPLVSVIIPCYNGAAFLELAVGSVLAQSYPRVEILVVDDGSTDNSSEIAQKLPIRYIRQEENRGLTTARNLGIQESKGSYLVFLDADDLLEPAAIEIGVSALGARPDCAMAVGDHLFIAADGSFLADSRKVCVPQSHYEALLRSNFVEMIASVLFRRSIFEELGGFQPALRVAEDYELYLRIARAHAICCHSAVVARYRLHGGNVSRNSELMLTSTLQVLKLQAAYIEDSPRLLHALHAGIQSWKKQYGRQLASEIAGSPAISGIDHLRRKLLLLGSQYPHGLFLILLLRMVPKLQNRRAVGAPQQPRVQAGKRLSQLPSPCRPPEIHY